MAGAAAAYRRKGYATEVVAAWVRDVLAAGNTPLYSTDWNNPGSLGVAARLGLVQSAVDVQMQ